MQVANVIFCQKRASVIEFLASARGNSALYAAYASSVFGLDYWVAVSDSPNGSYDDLTASDVALVVEAALSRRGRWSAGHGSQSSASSGGHEYGGGAHSGSNGTSTARGGSPRPSRATGGGPGWVLMQGDEESNLVTGYGSYVHQWPAGW